MRTLGLLYQGPVAVNIFAETGPDKMRHVSRLIKFSHILTIASDSSVSWALAVLIVVWTLGAVDNNLELADVKNAGDENRHATRKASPGDPHVHCRVQPVPSHN